MNTLHSRIFFIYLCIFGFYITINTENVAKLPYCSDNFKQTELIFVSTLDGKFSVLTSDGDLSWQIDTGPGSLLSSNIHKLELTNNGQWIRIIPSLSGSLYKFNGATIDPIPISADSLLTSSFRYLDDLAIAGGREVRTYGMLLNSGKQLYECSLHGCRNITEYPDEMDNIVIVERKTYTVRAVEPRTGVERWNFSVGQHDIKIPYLSCLDVNMKSSNINISAVLPEGLLVASKVERLTEIVWQHKFEAPIVAVWRWDGREITPLNLFSSPAVMTPKSKTDAPSIYVGMHNKQLYVHESNSMQNILQRSQSINDKDSVIESQSLTQIPWKPVPAVGVSLNPMDEDDSTALSVLYGSEYVNGNGYYLYTEDQAVCGNNITNSTSHHKINNRFLSWWKGAIIISIITIIVGNLIAYKYKMFSSVDLSKSQNSTTSMSPENEAISFSSRYIQEFDPITCLGKGGFGVVFQAKKKFDECDYAIKRITLPNKPAARDRMMREVKALAKLDHRNIVRYYNAWLESPPHDWQKKFDQQWLGDFSSFADNTASLSNVPSFYAINVEPHSGIESQLESLSRHIDSGEGSSIVFEGSIPFNTSVTTENNNSALKKGYSKFSESHSHNRSSVPAQVYLYIQMQLCCKESLKDWLHSSPTRDKNQSLAIFGQIVEAVEYVHFRGLIHRDLKPSNIFFSLEGQIKVGDFGLVTSIKEYDDDDEELFNASLKKSHTDAVGTHLYMSPEQLSGQQYNYKVDIYSLGIIFFELLFPFKTEMERINVLTDLHHRKYPKEFIESFHKEFELLDSMLSSDPQERPPATGIREKLYSDETDPKFEFKVPVNV